MAAGAAYSIIDKQGMKMVNSWVGISAQEVKVLEKMEK